MVKRLLLAAAVLVLLTACGGATFQKHTATDVITAFQKAGLSADNVKDSVRPANAVFPNVAVETKEFSIPAVAPKGGQVLVFKEQKDLETMQKWFAQFPALAPYVYTKGNTITQLDSGLPKLEAEKYKATLDAMK